MSIYRFYVYAYLREDGTPYYIGKGQGYRAYEKQRYIKPPKDKSRIVFYQKGLLEDDAFYLEISYIKLFGRKDIGTGILQNRTNGGEGPSGHRHTEESRNKMRKPRRDSSKMRKPRKQPRSPEHCLKLSMIAKQRKRLRNAQGHFL